MTAKDKQDWDRRTFLKNALLGAGALAIQPVMNDCNGPSHLHQGKGGMAAEQLPFHTDWLFGGLYSSGAMAPEFEDHSFERVTLPHCVSELSWHKWDPARWQQQWIYRKHFRISQAQQSGRRVFLKIGAAMTRATLWLNGQKLGTHMGGYLPLEYELTDQLKAGDNLLAIRLDADFDINVPPNKIGKGPRSVDFWQPGGLYRNATLCFVPRVFIQDLCVRPVDVMSAARKLQIRCTIDPGFIPEGRMALGLSLRSDDRVLATTSQALSLQGPGRQVLDVPWTDAAINELKCWDVDHPHLYWVGATLSLEGRPIHEYQVRFGVRDARFTPAGFFLNGRRLQLIGVNRHQFFPYMGGAVPDRLQAKDAQIIKADLQCNMVRCSHYPQSEAFFDACDELGLLAWEEAAGWGGPLGDAAWKESAVRAVAAMIKRDRNHPAIVVWGARLNETPDDVPLYTRTKKLAHRLDPSRQTTGAMIGGKHDTRDFVQDVFSYNDYKRSKGPDGRFQPELLPPRMDFPYLVSEAVGTLSGPAKYYRRIDSVAVQQSQAWAHARVQDLAASDKRYCGLLAWSGYDYPSGSGNQFEGVKYTGVIDLFRVPKPGAAIYQAQVDPAKKPVIAPAFYWDFGADALPLPEGQQAMICSNCERLEIFVGGRHYATVRPDEKQFPHLAYPPSFIAFKKVTASAKPELRIDGYVGKQKLLSRKFSADRSTDRLLVAADDAVLRADGADATRVVFRTVDRYGAARPHGKGVVSFTLEGPAVLIGESAFALEQTGGVGAVWIRTLEGQTGTIKLTAVHPDYGKYRLSVQARESI